MTGGPDDRAAVAALRAAELARTHQVLREQRARAEEFSAEVHEQAARVHEQLGDRALLDPAVLRAHAAEGRAVAAAERAALAEEQVEG